MEAVDACWDLSSTAPSRWSPGISFSPTHLSFLFLLQKHVRILAYVFNTHIHFM